MFFQHTNVWFFFYLWLNQYKIQYMLNWSNILSIEKYDLVGVDDGDENWWWLWLSINNDVSANESLVDSS